MGNLPAHWRIEFSGTIGASAPWATTLCMARPDVISSAGWDPDLYATQAAVAFRKLFQDGLSSLNATDTVFTQATARWYEANSTAAAMQATQPALAGAAGNQTVTGAASQACCVTLYTAHPGKTGRGRMYLPATAALGEAADAHRFPLARVSDLSGAFQIFLSDMRSNSPDSSHVFDPSVASVKDGAVRPWVRHSIDQRPDSQEHRERGLTFGRITRVHP